jgi:hypothetical protein
MKVKDLKKRLIGEKDDADVIIVLDKSDVDKINKIARTNPAILILDTEVSPDLVDDKVTIFVT